MQLKAAFLVTLAFITLTSSIESSGQILLKNRNGVILAEVAEHATGQLIIRGEYLDVGITVPPNPKVSVYRVTFESDPTKTLDSIYAYVWIENNCLRILTDLFDPTYAVDLETLRHGPSKIGCLSLR